MKKLNSTIYNKLILQAEEAKEQNMEKLAFGIFNSIGPIPEDDKISYEINQLQEDLYQGLWKLANCVIKYHDINSVDAEKMHHVLESLANKTLEEVEIALGINLDAIGPLESKLPGEE